MLDPRIYRTGLVVVVLAVIVFAFSLNSAPGALTTTLSPGAFNGQDAYTTMSTLNQLYPNRRPGSAGDGKVASYVASTLRTDGFTVTSSSFRGQTVDGPRTLQNVVGVRAGLSNGTVVVVAGRDALHPSSMAAMSGTGVLLELARDLSGETQQRSVVLASTSGTAGGAGAAELARTLPGPVDAVIVLGDVAGTSVRSPIVVPWSNGRLVAPEVLRSTIAAQLNAQAGLAAGSNSLVSQYLHLSFPMALTPQAPFVSQGVPSVLLSLSGDREPSATEPTSEAQIDALGRSVLATVGAIDGGPEITAPSDYLLYSGEVIPGWSIRLLVLALILPVVAATVDGFARARRRGHAVVPWIFWVLSSALPFALAGLLVRGFRLTGVINVAPPGPLAAGAVPLHGRATTILAILAGVIVVGLLGLRPLLLRVARARSVGAFLDVGGPGAAAGLLLVMSLAAIAVWLTNPFAALLLIPALHLWMWVVGSQRRLPRPLVLVCLLAGLALPVLAVLYWAGSMGLSIPGAAWNAVLLQAGGTVGLAAALEWSVVLGCAASMTLVTIRAMRQSRPAPQPVTVRGPVSYAGPGSLGGTGSALRR